MHGPLAYDIGIFVRVLMCVRVEGRGNSDVVPQVLSPFGLELAKQAALAGC